MMVLALSSMALDLAWWLRGTWTGIIYARRILHANHLIIEGDSTMIVTWIQESMQRESVHLLLRNIVTLLIECITIAARHVY